MELIVIYVIGPQFTQDSTEDVSIQIWAHFKSENFLRILQTLSRRSRLTVAYFSIFLESILQSLNKSATI